MYGVKRESADCGDHREDKGSGSGEAASQTGGVKGTSGEMRASHRTYALPDTQHLFMISILTSIFFSVL